MKDLVLGRLSVAKVYECDAVIPFAVKTGFSSSLRCNADILWP